MKFGWILALFVVAGCGPGRFSKTSANAKGNAYRISINVNPTTLDPLIVQDVETLPVIENVYEGLVAWDEKNHLVGQLAERWEMSADGKTYVFHLRKGVKFHNGRLLTADDVKFSLERACDPRLNSPTASGYLGDIVGAKDKLAGSTKQVSGVRVLDPYVVSITIDQPRAYFLGKLTYPCAFIVCKEAIDQGIEISRIDQMIGTGPFEAERFVPQQELTLKANPDYYEGRPKLDRVEEIVVKDAQTRIQKFRAGDIDNAGLSREDIRGLKMDPVLGPQVTLEPRPAVAYAAMNGNAYAPFKDARVRQAILMAIDRKKIVDELLGGVNPLADRILPPGIASGNVSTPPYDPRRAAELLAAAGYPNGKNLPLLELSVRAQTNDTRIIAESMVSQLKANLNIFVSIKSMEWRSMLEARNKNQLGFFILSWYADYPDPQNFLSNLLTTDGPGNHFGYSNPEVDSACRAGDREGDPMKRAAFYEQAEKKILDDAVWIPLFFAMDGELRSPRVQGVQQNLMGVMPYKKVTIR